MDNDVIQKMRERILEGEELDKDMMAEMIDSDPEAIMAGLLKALKATEEMRGHLLAVVMEYGTTAGLTGLVSAVEYALQVIERAGGDEDLALFLKSYEVMFKAHEIDATFKVGTKE